MLYMYVTLVHEKQPFAVSANYSATALAVIFNLRISPSSPEIAIRKITENTGPKTNLDLHPRTSTFPTHSFILRRPAGFDKFYIRGSLRLAKSSYRLNPPSPPTTQTQRKEQRKRNPPSANLSKSPSTCIPHHELSGHQQNISDYSQRSQGWLCCRRILCVSRQPDP